MNHVDLIDLVIASGPGIAAPTIERYRVARADLDAEQAGMLDALASAVDFFSVEPPPFAKIIDGAHKSRLSVTLIDHQTHAMSFVYSQTSAPVRALVDFVLEKGVSFDG